MKVFSTKDDRIEQIEDIQVKIDKIKYDIPQELLKPCQWLYPIEDNTKDSRVIAVTENAKRLKECYIINESKREYLESLRQQSNGTR